MTKKVEYDSSVPFPVRLLGTHTNHKKCKENQIKEIATLTDCFVNGR